MENSIEDRINNAYCFLNSMHSDFRTGLYYKEDLENLEHILSDYKRVLKENERYKKSDYETICLENNEFREITDRIQSEYNDLLKDNFKLKNELETKRKEYQETYKDVREELKELRKKNEELRAKWDKDTHILQNKLDYANADRIDLAQQNKELRKENEENKCLHCGKNIAGYCEECYQELIGENAKLQLELKEYKENALFICDPDKNEECKKNNCYINNGECMQTNNIKFRKENIACGIDKGSGEDQTAFVRFIPENLIKFKLAEAEKEIKNTYYQGRRNGKTII